MTKNEISAAAATIFNQLTDTCNTIKETDFFERPGEKWSVAENIQHLVLSTRTTTLAYSLPRFLVRWIAGTPNRDSRSFDELKEKYYKKLEAGGVATGRFKPKPIAEKYGKPKIMANWKNATAKFISAFEENRTEKDLDNYLVKHPLLGRITLRELCYFTIFHTVHHLNIIEKIIATKQ